MALIHKETAAMHKPDVRIRAAIVDDAAEVAHMAQALASEMGEHGKLDESAFLTAIKQSNPKAEFHVLEEQGNVVGFTLSYAGYDLTTAVSGTHLCDIYIKPEFRRRGHGKAVIGFLAEHTLQRGGQWMSLTVLQENMAAQQFYRALNITSVPVQFMAWGSGKLKSLTQ